MIPWKCLERVPTPDGGGELSLYQRGEELVIRVDGRDLMSSRQHHSEEALADIALDALTRPRSARVCVAGLGMGYTLAAVLHRLGERGRAVTIESSPDVLRWNRGPLADLAQHPLDDPRSETLIADIVDHLAEDGPAYDAILLDVDNGPEAWCFDSNRRLYDRPGLERIRAALAPGGVAAFWASQADPRFLKALRRAGFTGRRHTVRAHRGRGARHSIFVARP